MSNIFCSSCNSSKKLGIIRHEIITVLADSNTEKHDMELPDTMSATVKCFECGAEFLTSITLEYEVNPF
jgi:hypothetical protein